MNSDRPTVDLRLRTRVSDDEVAEKVGKILTADDYNLAPTRDCIIRKPDGKLLCIYRPALIPEALAEQAYPVLHELKDALTTNRGLASGTKRVDGASQRSYAMGVPSAIVGAFEAQGPKQFCRLTAFTGRETEKYRTLWPLLQFLGEQMRVNAPDRWEAQMAKVRETHPEWIIPGTPYTTLTVNNTYPTGVHKDAGDLDEGISTLAVLRRGNPFAGGVLTFPEYRVGVAMQDRDVIFMDAHAFHGNTAFDPPVKRAPGGRLLEDPGFERISIVAYYRTKMTSCGSADAEADRRKVYAEHRGAALVGE